MMQRDCTAHKLEPVRLGAEQQVKAAVQKAINNDAFWMDTFFNRDCEILGCIRCGRAEVRTSAASSGEFLVDVPAWRH